MGSSYSNWQERRLQTVGMWVRILHCPPNNRLQSDWKSCLFHEETLRSLSLRQPTKIHGSVAQSGLMHYPVTVDIAGSNPVRSAKQCLRRLIQDQDTKLSTWTMRVRIPSGTPNSWLVGIWVLFLAVYQEKRVRVPYESPINCECLGVAMVQWQHCRS